VFVFGLEGGGAGAVWEPLEYDCPHEFVVPKDNIFSGGGSATIELYTAGLKYGSGLFNSVSHVCSFEYVTISFHHPSFEHPAQAFGHRHRIASSRGFSQQKTSLLTSHITAFNYFQCDKEFDPY
jgi:hypothetical protein